jgi:hypothetical protein
MIIWRGKYMFGDEGQKHTGSELDNSLSFSRIINVLENPTYSVNNPNPASPTF